MAWDDFDFGGLGDWGTGAFDLPSLSPETNFFSDFFDPGSGIGEFGSNLMVFDNQTGQTIPFSQAMQIDPQAAQEFIGPLLPVGANQGGSGGMFGNLTGAQLAGLGIGGATAGVGLIGVIQKAMQGDQTAQQTIQRTLGQGTPQEQAALAQALSQFQTLNQFAMGSPTGLMQQLGARAPLEEAAFTSGLSGLAGQGMLSSQLLGSLIPALTGVTPQAGASGGIPSIPPAPVIPTIGGTPGTPGTPASPGGYASQDLARLFGPGTGAFDYLSGLAPNTPITTQGNMWVGPGGRGVGDINQYQNPSMLTQMAGTPGTAAVPGIPGTPDPNFAPQPYTYPGQGQYVWENGVWAWKPETPGAAPPAGSAPGPTRTPEQGGVDGTLGTIPGGAWGQGAIPPSGTPGATTGLPGVLGGQEQILNQLLQATQGNLSPGLLRLIEQSFQPQMGNIATQAIEAARQRGFAGGAELLNQAPAGALAGPALADLQGQMAQAKLGLIPMLGQAAGAYSTPAALRLAGTSQLLNLNQNIMQALMGAGQQGIQNRLGFMGAATGQLGTQGNLGNVGRLNTGTTTQTTSQPSSLLDAFAPLAGLLGGVGGLLGGFGAMQPRPTYNLNLSGVS